MQMICRSIPQVGLGVFKAAPGETYTAVLNALKVVSFTSTVYTDAHVPQPLHPVLENIRMSSSP
jgi:hypothetical protein